MRISQIEREPSIYTHSLSLEFVFFLHFFKEGFKSISLTTFWSLFDTLWWWEVQVREMHRDWNGKVALLNLTLKGNAYWKSSLDLFCWYYSMYKLKNISLWLLWGKTVSFWELKIVKSNCQFWLIKSFCCISSWLTCLSVQHATAGGIFLLNLIG